MKQHFCQGTVSKLGIVVKTKAELPERRVGRGGGHHRCHPQEPRRGRLGPGAGHVDVADAFPHFKVGTSGRSDMGARAICSSRSARLPVVSVGSVYRWRELCIPVPAGPGRITSVLGRHALVLDGEAVREEHHAGLRHGRVRMVLPGLFVVTDMSRSSSAHQGPDTQRRKSLHGYGRNRVAACFLELARTRDVDMSWQGYNGSTFMTSYELELETRKTLRHGRVRVRVGRRAAARESTPSFGNSFAGFVAARLDGFRRDGL